MNFIRPVVLLSLLGGCVNQWPVGSYNDLRKGNDSEVIAATISECTANLVPNHATVNVGVVQGTDTLTLIMPVALSRQGLLSDPTGIPITYAAASTGTYSVARETEGAFVRVVAPRGVCSQYFTRDVKGVLQSSGPLMIALR